jgi:hypothetical protein
MNAHAHTFARPRPMLAREARLEVMRPFLPAEVRFALILGPPPAKPVAYASLADLARGILRRRQGRVLQLSNTSLQLRDRPARTPGVLIIATDPIAEATDTLGFAILDGGDWKALQSAIRQVGGER